MRNPKVTYLIEYSDMFGFSQKPVRIELPASATLADAEYEALRHYVTSDFYLDSITQLGGRS